MFSSAAGGEDVEGCVGVYLSCELSFQGGEVLIVGGPDLAESFALRSGELGIGGFDELGPVGGGRKRHVSSLPLIGELHWTQTETRDRLLAAEAPVKQRFRNQAGSLLQTVMKI